MVTTESSPELDLYQIEKQNILNAKNKLPDIVVSNRYKDLKVLGLVADTSACGYYRVINPLHSLKIHGAEVNYSSFHSFDSFMSHDIIVAPRQHSPEVYEALRQAAWEGKGGTPDTKLLTPTGWTTFKDIKVGDQVIGSNGKSCGVIGRYDRGILPTYRVTFSDKSSVLCDGNHLWEVNRYCRRFDKYYRKERLTTLEILKCMDSASDDYAKFRIPMVKPVEFNKVEQPIDPYILGALLGDGALSSRNLYFCSNNKEILELIQEKLPADMYLSIVPDKEVYFRAYFKENNNEVNRFRKNLEDLGLLGTTSFSKFIPDAYLYGSPEQRLALIQGLMDTDGTVCQHSGQRHFTTVSPELAKGFKFLVQSLGGTVSEYYRKPYTKKNIKGVLTDYQGSYILSPSLPSGTEVFNYKQSRDTFNRKPPTRTISKIELVGNMPITCIAVDSPDRLYVTDDCIVTHNCIIYELDDDLHSVLPSSPAYQVYHPGSPELAMLPKIMYACHGVTTTTPEIARWYYKDNRNVAILGNYIDPGFRDWGMDVKYDLAGNPTVTLKDIQKPEEWKDKIVIMYSGGSTHGEDMQQIGHPLKKILEKYPNVQLALNLGINHVQDLIQKFNLPYDQVTYVPARHFLDHPTALHGADIGLAPLIPCQFNCAKSELKFLEMSAVGAVPVGSNVGPYARFNRKHPGYSLLVGNQGSDSFNTWEEALESLINNPEKLATMKAQARQLILDEYLLEKNIDRWPAAWMQIADNVRKGIVGRPDKIESIGHYKSYGRLGPNDPCPCGSGKKKKKCCGGAW